MPTIADTVMDQALNYIVSNVDKIQVVTSASSVLVSHASSASDIASAWGSVGAGSPNGRQVAFGGLSSLAVSTGGSAAKVRLVDSAAVLVVASISGSPGALGSSDSVNIGSFTIRIADPT